MKTIWQKYKEGIVVSIFLLAVGAVIYFAIIPLFEKIKDGRNKMEEERLSQEVRRRKLQSIPELKGQVEVISSQKELFNVLLDRNEAVGLIEMLETIAQQQGVSLDITVNQVQQDAKKQQKKDSAVSGEDADTKGKNNKKERIIVDDLPDREYLSLNIKCKGTFGGIFAFLRKLEVLSYVNNVVSLEIKETEKNSSNLIQNQGLFNSSAPNDNAVQPEDNDQAGDLEATMTVFFYYKS